MANEEPLAFYKIQDWFRELSLTLLEFSHALDAVARQDTRTTTYKISVSLFIVKVSQIHHSGHYWTLGMLTTWHGKERRKNNNVSKEALGRNDLQCSKASRMCASPFYMPIKRDHLRPCDKWLKETHPSTFTLKSCHSGLKPFCWA